MHPRTVDDKGVEVAVAVVVQKRRAAAHRLDDEALFGGAGNMCEIEADSGAEIGELDR
ncbi:MAG: hypothetical protein QGI32_26390 [Candidatus Latescibacteria bacterium]|nr:hypothetical protein [Candidatus Latescibacterota bacterium]